MDLHLAAWLDVDFVSSVNVCPLEEGGFFLLRGGAAFDTSQ